MARAAGAAAAPVYEGGVTLPASGAAPPAGASAGVACGGTSAAPTFSAAGGATVPGAVSCAGWVIANQKTPPTAAARMRVLRAKRGERGCRVWAKSEEGESREAEPRVAYELTCDGESESREPSDAGPSSAKSTGERPAS